MKLGRWGAMKSAGPLSNFCTLKLCRLAGKASVNLSISKTGDQAFILPAALPSSAP